MGIRWNWWIREYCGVEGCNNRLGDEYSKLTINLGGEDIEIAICDYHTHLATEEGAQ